MSISTGRCRSMLASFGSKQQLEEKDAASLTADFVCWHSGSLTYQPVPHEAASARQSSAVRELPKAVMGSSSAAESILGGILTCLPPVI